MCFRRRACICVARCGASDEWAKGPVIEGEVVVEERRQNLGRILQVAAEGHDGQRRARRPSAAADAELEQRRTEGRVGTIEVLGALGLGPHAIVGVDVVVRLVALALALEGCAASDLRRGRAVVAAPRRDDLGLERGHRDVRHRRVNQRHSRAVVEEPAGVLRSLGRDPSAGQRDELRACGHVVVVDVVDAVTGFGCGVAAPQGRLGDFMGLLGQGAVRRCFGHPDDVEEEHGPDFGIHAVRPVRHRLVEAAAVRARNACL
eukprot:Amastigsp_a678384_49.p2 type:complete len:261 gc:universal Amastigsp_a678384_49:1293-511(-)